MPDVLATDTHAVLKELIQPRTLTVKLDKIEPWHDISAPVDCRVEVCFEDEDDWTVEAVFFPYRVGRFGSFDKVGSWVRLEEKDPLALAVVDYCFREPGIVEVSDAVRDHMNDLAAASEME